MIEPKRVTLYTVIEKEVLLETPLTPNGYWVSYGHDLRPSLIKDWVEPQDESGPPEDLGVFYTMMQAHHVVNRFGENSFVSFDPMVEEIFRACEQKVQLDELGKRDRDINRLKGIIEKLKIQCSNRLAETEQRLNRDIESLRATSRRLEKDVLMGKQDTYRYLKIKMLQNAFVCSPLWRRLLIALFPVRHFK